ncbi:MAG: PEGA domain-containing protein [Candidatus Hatepunaea meridiana]|nr:PEGA domain-containing protein [Candidatus Hatepunaea meridiana]
MFKQILIVLSIVAIAQVSFSQELREIQWEDVPTRVIPDNFTYADKSILVVESTIAKLKFESSKGILEVKDQGGGVWWVILKPGVQLISISADGFKSLDNQRIFPQARQAVQVKISPKQVLGAYGGFDENRPEIRLKYKPESADEKVFGGLDGNVMKLDFSSGMRSFRPSSGKHVIKLNSKGRIWEKSYDLKSGETTEDVITFSSGKTERWDIKEPGGLDISSDPTGATVFIDQVNQGTTPLILDDIQPGTYQIELVKDLYLAESRQIVAKSLEYTPLSVELTPNFGRLKIESDPPEAMVWINGQQKGLTPYEVPRFNAGKYALRLAQNLYYEETDTFEIKPGGEYVNSYKLRPQFGKVTLTSEPSNATVTVDGQLWGNTPLTRDKVLSGEHNIKLTYNNYFDQEETIRISDGQNFERKYDLRPSVGWLTISSDPPGANVTITETNQSLGKTPLTKVPIDRGTYKLLIEKELYEPYETAIGLTYGGEQNVDAKLQRSVGHIRVSVEPRGTKIYLNNEYKGESPMVVKDVPTGKYELKLDKSGYDIKVVQVQVTRNEVTKYSLTLGTEGTVKWKKRRTKARLLSIIVPSSGQFVSGQYVRGALYGGAFIGTLAMAYLSQQDHADAKSNYVSEMDAYNNSATQANLRLHLNNANSAWDDMKSAEDQINLMLIAAGGVYVLQLLDVWLWGGGKRPVAKTFGMDWQLEPYASTDDHNPKIGLKITWGDK